jgi:hypothetical protein
LFNRDFVLNAGGLLISTRDPRTLDARPTLRVIFQITRALNKDPNTADVSIFNLRKENRSRLQEKGISTIIEAGYVDNISQIFGGDLQFGSTVRDGSDWITTIQSGDGSKAYKSARISKSFAGPVPVERVLEVVGKSLGVDLGNLLKKVDKGSLRDKFKEFSNGVVLKGKSEKVFQEIVKSMGYSASIQDEEIQMLEPGETIGGKAILLSPGTGLIGSPEPGEEGIVKARSLLQPGLLPGRGVKIEAREVDGFFRVDKVVFSGDTWGDDWYSDLELKPL